MMSESPHILVADDERTVREPLAQYLARNGCRVVQAKDAREVRRTILSHSFDLVILDVMMPGEDGFSLCRHLRETYDVPILLLTARAEETDRVVGLELGADDYVTKPFSPRELLARIKAIIRRASAVPAKLRLQERQTLVFGSWTLKTAERQLISDDEVAIPLSTIEFNLLMVFISRPNIVLSREQLLDLTQGREIAVFDRSIDNQVSRLRKKLERDPRNPEYIKTVWGEGYVFPVAVKQV